MSEVANLKTIETLDRSPFKYMVATIGNLPTSFVDSMSYYECIAWLVKYLETEVIPTVNNNAEAVAELQAAYIQLKEFVDNYFENLDVQEEINNKLDEMADQGQLADIISQYLNSTAVFGYDSVASMKTAVNLVNGSYARTLGYYNKNDGGGALYKIRNITNDDVVDEKFIIEITSDPDNNLVGELIVEDKLNVLCLGANNTNFATVVNYALSDGRYDVYIPYGNYTCDDTIVINGNDKNLVCDGNITSTASTLFQIYGYRNYVHLNGRYIGDSQTTSIFMLLSGDSNIVSNNIYVHATAEFGTAVKIMPTGNKGCSYNTIKFDAFNTCKAYGFYITTGTGVNFVAENNIEGGRISGATGMLSGIKFVKGANQADQFNANIFDHVCIDDHYNIGIDIEFALYNKFIDARLSEGLDGTYYVKLGTGCAYNYFSTKSGFRTTQINDNTTDWTQKNFFESRLIGSDTYLLCNKFYTCKGYFITNRDENVYGIGRSKVFYTYNSTTEHTTPEFYMNGATVVRLGHDTSGTDTFTYQLPSVFSPSGINEFYLEITNLNTANGINIVDSNNTTIVNRDSIGTGTITKKFFRVECIGNIENNQWKVTPTNG